MTEYNKSKRIYCIRRKTLMCTTCNCFKHKSSDIYYTALTVIFIKNMINKRNHTVTVRHVSQCPSLRYSFSFSRKCPGLVGASSRLQSDALCENAHRHADYRAAQWAVTTLVRYATRSSRRILRVRRAPRQSLRSVPTNILRNTVMVCLQQLALLAPTLRPTRWQQSVSTGRRRRNFRRVGVLAGL